MSTTWDINQADTFNRTTKELGHYIGKKYTMETMMAIKKLKDHVYIRPSMPQTLDKTLGTHTGAMRDKTETELSYMEKKEIEMGIRKYLNKEDQYTMDMHQIYSIIVGKCSDAMIQKMKADADYTTVEDKCDPIGILQIIRKICYS